MYIKKVDLKNFSAFDKADLELCPGINVLIGANATGKTHLLKLLYAVCASAPKRSEPGNAERFEKRVESKLINVFKPDEDGLERLIRGDETEACIDVQFNQGKVEFEIDVSGGLDVAKSSFKDQVRSLFIPSKEVLSLFPGFVETYMAKDIAFDETYNDICVALSGSYLKSKSPERVAMIDELEKDLGGKVYFSGKDFRIKAQGDKYGTEAHLISEGMRKLAMLAHLLSTGAIRRDGILFWDEPESSLNPRFVTKIANFIRRLAAMNVQVILATHDYLLSRELSLAAEYCEAPVVPTRFFCFQRENLQSPATINSGERLADLDKNPILQEFSRHYDREQTLFYDSAEKGVKKHAH